MDARTLFIVNPRAGRGQSYARWLALERNLRKLPELSFDTHITSCAGEAERVAREAVQAAFRNVVVVGGDGTINEVVNGVAGEDVNLGIIPFGTGNDLARALAIPSSHDEVVRMLLGPRFVKIDTATINGRYFLAAAGTGFDGIVAHVMNTSRVLKRIGKLGYFFTALGVLPSFRPKQIRLTLDGRTLEVSGTWLLAVGNCPYYGGGMKLFPTAQYDDQRLDVCIVSNLNKPKFVQALPLVYSGNHIKKPYVQVLQGREILIECPDNTHAHADGETISGSVFHIRVAEHSLRLMTSAANAT